MYPDHFRSFPSVASIQAGGRLFAEAWYGGVKTCPYKAGIRFGSWRPWGWILFFAGITGHFRALGFCLCGSGGWVRKFHVPAHFRSFPSVASIQAGGRLFAEAWYGGVKTCPYKAGIRFGSWRPWGRILFFAGITGHFRVLGWVPACAGVAVGCGNFLYPDHFRSFPSVASIQAGGSLIAEAWCGRVKTCPYKAGTRFGRWRPWGRILFFAGNSENVRVWAGFPPVREWRLGAEIFCIPIISAHFRALPP